MDLDLNGKVRGRGERRAEEQSLQRDLASSKRGSCLAIEP